MLVRRWGMLVCWWGMLIRSRWGMLVRWWGMLVCRWGMLVRKWGMLVRSWWGIHVPSPPFIPQVPATTHPEGLKRLTIAFKNPNNVHNCFQFFACFVVSL